MAQIIRERFSKPADEFAAKFVASIDADANLHTARSRNDQVALDLRLWTWAVSAEIVKLIHDLQKSLASRAKENAETIFPGITHLQHAQPIVFGHVLLCYHDRLGRDAGRFEDAIKRITISPLGACAMAGTSFPTDPSHTARELGFPATFTNSIDAVSDRDFAAEFAAACSILMVHLSQIAEDMIYWSTPEFGFVELPDE